MYCFLRTPVYMSVRRSAFSFVTNNLCTLEFVNHLGKLRRVRWIFIHYDIDVASAVLKEKKVRKKNYKLLLNPCMSVRLSVNRLDISIEFLKFVKYDETLIVQDIVLFLYVCGTKVKPGYITQTIMFLK